MGLLLDEHVFTACRKVFLEQLAHGLHNAVSSARLGRVLVNRVVTDEFALAVVRDAELAGESRKPVCIVAGYLLLLCPSCG